MSSDYGEIDWCLLPEGCVANVLSLTNPRDASRLSLVASTFRWAAESDAVWKKFLPSDYQDLIGRAVDSDSSSSSSTPVVFKSKKELYLHLCDHPLLIDGGFKSFSLEKWSGKKCYMLAARDLTIVWSCTPWYWSWTSLPESRFTEVAELMNVCWLEIRGKINTSMLSPNTNYAAYLVFKSTTEAVGFENQPVECWVGISGSEGEGEGEKRIIYLDPEAEGTQPTISQFPKRRGDGWLEIELGEYVNNGGDGELEMSLMEVEGGQWKRGLIVQGIEIRPKEKIGV